MKTKRRTPQAPESLVTIADLKGSLPEQFLHAEGDLAKLHLVSPNIVHAIVGLGPLNDGNELVDSTLTALANKRFATGTQMEALKKWIDEAVAKGMPPRLPGATQARSDAYVLDAAFNYGFSFAQAGYLVGITVGRQMGGTR